MQCCLGVGARGSVRVLLAALLFGIASSLVLLASACSGGGGGGSTPNRTPTPTPTPTATPTPTPSPTAIALAADRCTSGGVAQVQLQPGTVTSGSYPVFVCIVDLDGNGKNEVVVGFVSSGFSAPEISKLIIINSDGTVRGTVPTPSVTFTRNKSTQAVRSGLSGKKLAGH